MTNAHRIFILKTSWVSDQLRKVDMIPYHMIRVWKNLTEGKNYSFRTDVRGFFTPNGWYTCPEWIDMLGFSIPRRFWNYMTVKIDNLIWPTPISRLNEHLLARMGSDAELAKRRRRWSSREID